MNLKGNILISTTDFGGVYLLQDVVSVSLPVNERMMIKKNHFEPYNLTGNEKRICIVTVFTAMSWRGSTFAMS